MFSSRVLTDLNLLRFRLWLLAVSALQISRTRDQFRDAKYFVSRVEGWVYNEHIGIINTDNSTLIQRQVIDVLVASFHFVFHVIPQFLAMSYV